MAAAKKALREMKNPRHWQPLAPDLEKAFAEIENARTTSAEWQQIRASFSPEAIEANKRRTLAIGQRLAAGR